MNVRRFADQRGAVLVHVAVALLGLLAFSVFVFDYGVMWVSRRQAQNAADAAAHAGAVALAYDNATDYSTTGPAYLSAIGAATSNSVFGATVAAADVDVFFKDTVPCPDGSTNNCVRADVYAGAQDAAGGGVRGAAPPSFLLPLVSPTATNGVRATATAEVFQGTATDCLKPWGVIDRWQEHWVNGKLANPDPSPWTNDSTYDKYKQNGTLDPKVTNPDAYDQGRDGFRLMNTDGTFGADFGFPLTLNRDPNQYNAGWFQSLDLPCSNNGTDCYNDNIKGCNQQILGIGDQVTFKTGDMGVNTDNSVINDPVDPSKGDIGSLCNQDPYAHWDPTLNNNRGGVADSNGARIVAVPLLSPEDVTQIKNGKTSATIQNIMGMFIHCPSDPPDPAFPTHKNGEVQGRLIPVTGLVGNGNGNANGASFLITVALVR